MSSILTNNSAMVALATLEKVTMNLNETQNRVSSGLSIRSGKENAAYFAISETMKADSGMFKAIDEGLTATKNSVTTARVGAEQVADIAQEFSERVAFAQTNAIEVGDVQQELDAMVERIGAAINQATFNGDDLVSGTATTITVVTGITRVALTTGTGTTATTNTFRATTMTFDSVDLSAIQTTLAGIDLTTSTDLAAELETVQGALTSAIDAATSLGITEKKLEGQQEFLGALTDTLDSGVGAMVDADMEEEAARLQALQVQQQLATQSLSIANQAPQSIMSLFR